MADINGYKIIGELTPNNSGYSKWGFARKNGVEVFIKEFLSPVYPLDATVLSREQILRKRDICNQFESEKKNFYTQLNKCSTGNIVTVTDFFRSGSRYYMVTEKVDAAAISPNEISRFSLEQKILVVKIIVHCMRSLHSHGIVHGDIKPDNILFKRTPRGTYTAKIIDFDSSFLEIEPPKDSEDFQGDMVYLAPESFLFIAEEEDKLSRKIDIFALGVLFHQYFSGQLPGFDKRVYDYAFEAVLDGCELIMHPIIPENFKELLKRMLACDPEERPDIEEIYNILIGAVTEKPEDSEVKTPPVPAPPKDTPASNPSAPKGFSRARTLI